MNVLLLATAFFAIAAPPKAPVTVSVDAKNGDVISGEHPFKVTVNSQNLVTQVEFYYNDDLRDKATSTPYMFTLDALNETDGNAKLRFKAYTSEGETGEATVTVKIYNGLDKGLDYHLQQGTTALQDGKYDTAITEGRIALKVDNSSNAARVLVARAYMHKYVYDKAQKFAEDAVASDPNNLDALNLVATINLEKAFTTFNRGGGDRTETLKSIGEAVKTAVESRKKALDSGVEKIGPLTDANMIKYVDAAIRAGRYSLVVNALQPAFVKDNRKSEIADRLAFAQIRMGRYNDALQTVVLNKKYGTLDAYGAATLAVLQAEAGNAQASDDAIKDAILADADNPIVTTSQAYIALKFVRDHLANQSTMRLNYDDLKGKDTPSAIEARNTLATILRQLARDQGQRTEVNYYLCALNNKLENYSDAQKYFEQAVLTEPTNYDAYIEQGNKSITVALHGGKLPKEELAFLYEDARTMFDAALTARPSSSAALTGLSLVGSFEGKSDEAIKWGQAAVQAEPNYAPGWVALCAAYTAGQLGLSYQAVDARQNAKNLASNEERQQNEIKVRHIEAQAGDYSRKAREALDKAQKLDTKIQGTELTKAPAAWRYYNVGGRVPVLPPPGG